MRSAGFVRFTGFILAVVVISLMSGGCRSVRNAVTAKPESEDANIWRLSNGKILVLVDAKHGRIVHYGLRNNAAGIRIDQNVLWKNTEPENPKYIIGGWNNWGGDKLWIWPQRTDSKYTYSWSWPPPEPVDGYTVEPTSDRMGLIMTSGVMPDYGMRMVRKIEINEETTTVIITSRFERVRESFGNPIGAWSITQVPTPKELYARLPLVSDRNRFLAAQDGYTKQVSGQVVRLEPKAAGGAKAFMNADVMAAVYDDVVFLQRQIPAHSQGFWNEDERAQLYSHGTTNVPPGPTYTEIEWTSPMLPSNQIENTTLKVAWKLVPIEKKTSQQDIENMIGTLP